MSKLSATLLGAIAAMSWLGPLPIPPPEMAQLLQPDDNREPRPEPHVVGSGRFAPVAVASAAN